MNCSTVYAAEVWSLETRATGMALASIANWLFNFAIGFFIPPAFENITWRLFSKLLLLCLGRTLMLWTSHLRRPLLRRRRAGLC